MEKEGHQIMHSKQVELKKLTIAFKKALGWDLCSFFQQIWGNSCYVYVLRVNVMGLLD